MGHNLCRGETEPILLTWHAQMILCYSSKIWEVLIVEISIEWLMLGSLMLPIKKKWYKKSFLGIVDFCLLLQAFTALNSSVDHLHQNRRGISDVKRRKLIKWQFYLVLAEELMMYRDDSGDDSTLLHRVTHPFIEWWKDMYRHHILVLTKVK